MAAGEFLVQAGLGFMQLFCEIAGIGTVGDPLDLAPHGFCQEARLGGVLQGTKLVCVDILGPDLADDHTGAE